MRLPALLSVVCLLAVSSPLFAADQKDDQKEEEQQPRLTAMVVTEPATERPAALMPMYIGLAALQAFDGYSTYRGVHSGANEQNPLVGGLAAQPAALWTLKAVSTVTSIYFAEQLWRNHHKGQAILTMVVANGAMALVAARNASSLQGR
jgi:uncharacterized protein DUF5658